MAKGRRVNPKDNGFSRPRKGAGGIPERSLQMSIIVRDNRTGKVKMASISTIEKDGRTLLFPQMIDITGIEDEDKIIEIIMEFEENFEPEKETRKEKKLRKKAEKAWLKIWNS